MTDLLALSLRSINHSTDRTVFEIPGRQIEKYLSKAGYCHLAVTLITDTQGMNTITTRNASATIAGYAAWIRQLPLATEILFAARTPAGRSMKILLFGIGMALPLGIIILLLLFWHGTSVRHRTTHPRPQDQGHPPTVLKPAIPTRLA
jgi:hypothetical protein